MEKKEVLITLALERCLDAEKAYLDHGDSQLSIPIIIHCLKEARNFLLQATNEKS